MYIVRKGERENQIIEGILVIWLSKTFYNILIGSLHLLSLCLVIG